jgi:hypothetical protein
MEMPTRNTNQRPIFYVFGVIISYLEEVGYFKTNAVTLHTLIIQRFGTYTRAGKFRHRRA